MGMTAILVMWPRPHEQTAIYTIHKGSTWNLASIGLESLEIFVNVHRKTTGDDGSCLYY